MRRFYLVKGSDGLYYSWRDEPKDTPDAYCLLDGDDYMGAHELVSECQMESEGEDLEFQIITVEITSFEYVNVESEDVERPDFTD